MLTERQVRDASKHRTRIMLPAMFIALAAMILYFLAAAEFRGRAARCECALWKSGRRAYANRTDSSGDSRVPCATLRGREAPGAIQDVLSLLWNRSQQLYDTIVGDALLPEMPEASRGWREGPLGGRLPAVSRSSRAGATEDHVVVIPRPRSRVLGLVLHRSLDLAAMPAMSRDDAARWYSDCGLDLVAHAPAALRAAVPAFIAALGACLRRLLAKQLAKSTTSPISCRTDPLN